MSLDTLKTRIDYIGGDNIGRIKQQKLKSFRAALKNDYNSRPIITPLGKISRVLINDDNTKSDYDKRYVSADFNDKMNPGDVFQCTDDNSRWMIYLPDLVEVSYLKAEIIRCDYKITIEDTDYWVYFQGPTETALRWNLKDNTNWNDLNFSGTLYIKKDEKTEKYFNRFTKIKINGHTWQVKVVDTITVQGIIELELGEYFDSQTEDLVEVYNADSTFTDPIIGQCKVEPGMTVGYQIVDSLFDNTTSWEISNNNDVSIEKLQANGRTCIIKIAETAQGNFDIIYGDSFLTVTIAQPTTMIQGKTEVYPYGTYVYTAENISGMFSIEGNGAEIISQENGQCKIEITASRKGSFILKYITNNTEYHLLIKILSL